MTWRNSITALPRSCFPRAIARSSSWEIPALDKAADAIRFAMEELPASILLGAYIEIDEARLGHQDIRDLYESADYPLKKPAVN